MSRLFAVAMVVGALTAFTASRADAYVAPGATIVSASLERLEQADDTTLQVAISGDGRYVAFATRARNLFADDDPDPKGQFRAGGIFRRDLQTGSLELVAHGDLRPEAAPDTLIVRGALNPSLSGDGRYVAFSTGWQLTPDDTNGNVDVYVRDMSVPRTSPGAYTLVSRSGSGAPARYAAPPEGQDRPGVNPGSEITARSAISADGRKVVFKTVDVASDLPAEPDVTTPGQQVFVRDLDTGTTHLVTREQTSGSPAGGALGAAVLSADGTTVAWVGRNAPTQTPFVTGEGANPAFEYYLWQRIADGPNAPTRRVTGFVDPEDPGCTPGAAVIDSPTLLGPCYGPLTANEGFLGGIVNAAPALSQDGTRVAYLTNASLRGGTLGGTGSDLFVTDMAAGRGRKATTIELTRDGGATPATNAAIDAFAMSADGRWLAISTFRSGQVTPILRQAGTSRTQATARDVHLIDLVERTIERATIGAGGADTDGSTTGLPDLSRDGRRLAFLSSATNFFFGDANARADAFVVDRLDAPPAQPPPPAEPEDASLPPVIDIATEPPAPTRLTVRAGRSSKASVLIRIKLPEPGTGTATARGRLRNADGKRIGSTRRLASAKVRATKAATVSVRLKVPRSLRGRLRTAGRLTASTQIEFEGRSGKQYVGRVTVEFKP